MAIRVSGFIKNGMRKIRKTSDNRFTFFCPGCKEAHCFSSSWSFNGDYFDKPTVTPSLLVTNGNPEYRCHSFITDGKIQFLDDCSHSLKGQTIELEAF